MDTFFFTFFPKTSLVWKVKNFLHSSEERKSSYFTFRGVKCRMILDLTVSKNADEECFTLYIEVNGEHTGEFNDIAIQSSIKDQYGRKYFSLREFLNNFPSESRVNIWCVNRQSISAKFDDLISQPNETLTFLCEFEPLIEHAAIVVKPNELPEENCVPDEDARCTSEGMSNKEISSQPLTSEDTTTSKIKESFSEASRTRNEKNENSELEEKANESIGTEGATSGIKPVDHFRRLSLDFGDLLATRKGADIILKCTHRKFLVHRSILWSRCRKFAEKCLKEKREGIIEVTDTDSFVLEKFLEFVYTGNISNLTENIAMELYTFGYKYRFEPLILPCAEFLVKKLNDENIRSIFCLASLYDDKNTLKDIIRFIINTKKILKGDNWFQTTFDSPDVLLAVYKAIDVYGKY